MIIQATPYGTKKEEPFAFTYSGSFVDERDAKGKGDVTLNTSGDFIVTEGTRKVTVYILAAGGGGVSVGTVRSGGGGGNQTVEVELVPGTYRITIGTGGAGKYRTSSSATGGNGGDTSAFGFTSTGGKGPQHTSYGSSYDYNGAGGTPNGGDGTVSFTAGGFAKGGTPNGGDAQGDTKANGGGYANSGGNGLVRITFS